MRRVRKLLSLKNIGYVLFLVLFTILALEVMLRLYNPFASRLRGDKIMLPVNRVHHIENDHNPRLDKYILRTTNSLGFRGPEKPNDLENRLSIVTVGGSTTECYYLSDDKTWSAVLMRDLESSFERVWLNNAGLDGHSTFGHQILLDDFLVRLRPKIILYLVGANDVGREDLVDYDESIIDRPLANVLKKSEIFNIYLNYHRAEAARRLGVKHEHLDFARVGTRDLSTDEMDRILAQHNQWLKDFRTRLLRLIESTKAAGIEPILLTQPTVVGVGVDPETGADLKKIALSAGSNGELYWRTLELYNQQTREIGRATNTTVIDLAVEMPKSTEFYYDAIHFTNAGAARVASVIAKDIRLYLKSNYSEYVKLGS
ncbi:MAG TPA: SGNH/GDSL hydrolase family protein [Pyrinomonadaceae bacterium]|nr:SGNH/GDSL hydrolase family protein [Pyrinomonadaceae bacterium]HMP66316.1 SGNH/GDSL hydrolase family protein [Pyrinomonadaceae bacterium]